MGRGKLTDREIQVLNSNPNVLVANKSRIIYSNEFKIRYMEDYLAGKKPTTIFQEAGFDPEILGDKRIERASARWRESYQSNKLGKYQYGVSKAND